MKPVKYICLTVSIVLFIISIFLKNTIAQTIIILIAFVFFEFWVHFVKNDRKHNGH